MRVQAYEDNQRRADGEDRANGARVKVAILAGGLGSRLGQLSRGLPKAMIRVAGRPFLEHVIASFASRGLREFLLLVGHHADVIEAHFRRGDAFNVQIEYSRETKLLGTGGALREARHLLTDRFIVTYGDVLRMFDYDRFVAEHENNCLAVYSAISSGNTEVANGRVLRFDKTVTDLPYVDAGFAVLDKNVIDLLPTDEVSSFEQHVYGRLAAQTQLAYEIVDHDFYDIGTPTELARTRASLEVAQ